MSNDKTISGSSTNVTQATNTPPLFKAMIKAFKKDVVITVSMSGVNVPITISQGRVINVRHERTAFQSVLDMLVRTGVLSKNDLSRAERDARSQATTIEDTVVSLGFVSEGTLESVQEMLCLEVLMDLLLRTNVDISVEWETDPNIRELCTLPIRFLLREAQKRSLDLPKVKRLVPSSKVLFAKTTALSGLGGAQNWADLQIGAADKQVYFFVDGNRNVADLALASCQSEFKVARSLMTLSDLKLVRRLAPNEPRSAATQAPGQAIGKWSALVLSCVGIVGIAIGVNLGMGAVKPPSRVAASHAFDSVVEGSSPRRLNAAARQYDLVHGRAPESFDDLLRDRLIRREDLTVQSH